MVLGKERFIFYFYFIEQIELDVPLSEAPSHMPTEEEDKQEDYYNITSFDKKSPTAIMLDDLVEFVLTQKTTRTKLEEQFNVDIICLSYGLVRPCVNYIIFSTSQKQRWGYYFITCCPYYTV